MKHDEVMQCALCFFSTFLALTAKGCVFLCDASIKEVIRLDELGQFFFLIRLDMRLKYKEGHKTYYGKLFFEMHLERRTKKGSSGYGLVTRFVPVFILETHNQTTKCLPMFVQTDNATIV